MSDARRTRFGKGTRPHEPLKRNGKETPASTPSPEDDLGLVGRSAAISRLRDDVRRIAPSNASVLVTGENGTGKEVLARALWSCSQRARQRFLAVNCGALNEHLLESELFGHVRGAFTGASNDKKGFFEAADGGTLFLDEIGDTSAALQVKLLRVLQEGTFLPAGGTEEKRVDVRILSATNKDLAKLIRKGTFREDLFHRLRTFELAVPALRDRAEDIAMLSEHFLDMYARKSESPRKRLAPEARGLLMRHDWPGNIRELKNQIERMAIFAGTEELIRPEHASDTLQIAAPKPVSFDLSNGIEPLVNAYTRTLVQFALSRNPNNFTAAARECGYTLQGFKDLCARIGLFLPKGHAKKHAV